MGCLTGAFDIVHGTSDSWHFGDEEHVSPMSNVKYPMYDVECTCQTTHLPIASSDVRPIYSAYRLSIGAHFKPTAGPMYSARGRMSLLLEYCSRMCAVQPDMRLTAKKGVNKSIGIPPM